MQMFIKYTNIRAMKTIFILLSVLLLAICFGCEKEDDTQQEQESNEPEKVYI